MGQLVLFIGLAIALVIMAFLSVSPNMKPNPWRFAASGVGLLIMGFLFQLSLQVVSKFAAGGEKLIYEISANFFAVMIPAMVGALFGAAIAHRADSLHEQAVKQAVSGLNSLEELYRGRIEEVTQRLINEDLPRDDFMALHEQRVRLIVSFHDKRFEFEDELNKLLPNGHRDKSND